MCKWCDLRGREQEWAKRCQLIALACARPARAPSSRAPRSRKASGKLRTKGYNQVPQHKPQHRTEF